MELKIFGHERAPTICFCDVYGKPREYISGLDFSCLGVGAPTPLFPVKFQNSPRRIFFLRGNCSAGHRNMANPVLWCPLSRRTKRILEKANSLVKEQKHFTQCPMDVEQLLNNPSETPLHWIRGHKSLTDVSTPMSKTTTRNLHWPGFEN